MLLILAMGTLSTHTHTHTHETSLNSLTDKDECWLGAILEHLVPQLSQAFPTKHPPTLANIENRWALSRWFWCDCHQNRKQNLKPEWQFTFIIHQHLWTFKPGSFDWEWWWWWCCWMVAMGRISFLFCFKKIYSLFQVVCSIETDASKCFV